MGMDSCLTTATDVVMWMDWTRLLQLILEEKNNNNNNDNNNNNNTNHFNGAITQKLI